MELFASGDPEKIKLTMWFYGYCTAMKRCIALESQNFDGLLELICIHGGPITTVEAQEMPRILADAAHEVVDAGVDFCGIGEQPQTHHDDDAAGLGPGPALRNRARSLVVLADETAA